MLVLMAFIMILKKVNIRSIKDLNMVFCIVVLLIGWLFTVILAVKRCSNLKWQLEVKDRDLRFANADRDIAWKFADEQMKEIKKLKGVKNDD